MKNCTGRNCPIQKGMVDPATCKLKYCSWFTTPKTKADDIRAMTDEELAELFSRLKQSPDCNSKCHMEFEKYGEQRTFCSDCWLDWLKQEVQK